MVSEPLGFSNPLGSEGFIKWFRNPLGSGLVVQEFLWKNSLEERSFMNIDIEKFEQMMRTRNLNHLLSEQTYLSNKIEDLKLVVSSQQRLIKLHEENLSSYQALKVDYEKLQAPRQMSLDKSIEELRIVIEQPVNELTRRRRQ